MATDLKETIKKVRELASIPLKKDEEIKRVEIIMLKFKEGPEVIDKAISRIIHNTTWPFKLTIFDNRPNSANTSKIWNKLVGESTCRYVLLIDSDAFIPSNLEPCWLTRMMESIDDTGIVVPVSSSRGGARQYVHSPEKYGSKEINKDPWSGFCFLFDKERIWNFERFDERFYIYGQDSEWAIRTGKKFGGAIMRKDVLVEHLHGYSFNNDPMRDADKFYAEKLFQYLLKKYGEEK